MNYLLDYLKYVTFSFGSKLYSDSKKLVMNAIEINSLTKNFKDSTAVDNISLDVEEGEIFGFLGPNGAGKSTTMMILTTLLNLPLEMHLFVDLM